MKFTFKLVAASAVMAMAGAAFAQSGQTVKIAMIEGFSGPFANVGLNQLHSWQYVAQELGGKNNPAGVTFQIVPFDSGGSPQNAVTQLKAAIDQGFRYITQGNGSGAALALSQAVTKYNERNPGHELVYMNYAAIDPGLTNQDCSFWHFELDANVTMKMEALTSFIKDQPQVKKVYLLDQDYSYGHDMSKYFQKYLKEKRPDIQIVGDVFVPIGQVKDFAPYVAKIKESGADAIMSGNWGTDLTLFVKALAQAGVNLPIYTNYAVVSGTPTAIAALGDKANVYAVAYGYSQTTGEVGKIAEGFKKKYNDDFYTQAILNGINLLDAAMAKAHSTDPKKVAFAMEGLSVPSWAGDVTMRKSDHQLQQAMFITKWEKVSKKYPYSQENTGYTFAPIKEFPPYVASTPTSCQMKRPSEG
ncbi:MAG: branched-chain amino acid ABC transporter substrate-binding protein [Burkholderiaceae bacterium]|nr:branched-chain amino acid ABC transporter substrate-binding protein [Burkholderiales bacterium]TAL72771.1 MAG: branched-chain amino acid ABC transporter substrate-binding protein [Burkholderiaceae bacterium]TBR75927.1 MAG: branched-chain amino acid ABC transporter substrate-binding protein [Burkholderiaceae bacterium]